MHGAKSVMIFNNVKEDLLYNTYKRLDFLFSYLKKRCYLICVDSPFHFGKVEDSCQFFRNGGISG